MVPNFNSDGLLPPGEYEVTLAGLRGSILVNGDGTSPTWDREWRSKLVDNVGILAAQLRSVGFPVLYIDGSFVENKDHPNDVDCYFDCFEPDDFIRLASGELLDSLNLIDPYKVWTWRNEDRRPYPGYAKKQLPMWHKYRVEIYPNTGRPSGIHDGKGKSLRFDQAFRLSRFEDKPKGVIKLIS